MASAKPTLKQKLTARYLGESIDDLAIEDVIASIQFGNPGRQNRLVAAVQATDANRVGLLLLQMVREQFAPQAAANAQAKIDSDEFTADDVAELLEG